MQDINHGVYQPPVFFFFFLTRLLKSTSILCQTLPVSNFLSKATWSGGSVIFGFDRVRALLLMLGFRPCGDLFNMTRTRASRASVWTSQNLPDLNLYFILWYLGFVLAKKKVNRISMDLSLSLSILFKAWFFWPLRNVASRKVNLLLHLACLTCKKYRLIARHAY